MIIHVRALSMAARDPFEVFEGVWWYLERCPPAAFAPGVGVVLRVDDEWFAKILADLIPLTLQLWAAKVNVLDDVVSLRIELQYPRPDLEHLVVLA